MFFNLTGSLLKQFMKDKKDPSLIVVDKLGIHVGIYLDNENKYYLKIKQGETDSLLDKGRKVLKRFK